MNHPDNETVRPASFASIGHATAPELRGHEWRSGCGVVAGVVSPDAAYWLTNPVWLSGRPAASQHDLGGGEFLQCFVDVVDGVG